MFSSFTRSATASKVFASSSTPVDEILARDDLQDIVYNPDGPGQRNMIAYVDKHVARILSAQQKDGVSDRVVSNACTLLVRYLQTHPKADEAIRCVVPSTIAIYARKGILPSRVCSSVQKVLLAAFDEDFSRTSYSINISLGDEIIHGAIRNLSYHAVAGETLIALFGSALSAATMMMPATTPNTFTDIWIKYNFPLHVAAYCRVAMSSIDLQPYFLFMQEILKRGLSHSAGPIVDAILQATSFEILIHSVVECNEASCTAQRQGLSDEFPLASDGLALIAACLTLIRKTIPPTETQRHYTASIEHCAPISRICAVLPRLVGLLEYHEPTSGGSRRVFGCRRLAVLDILSELVACNIFGVDKALVEAGALEAMMDLWKLFPNNDFIGRAVERSLTALFLRRKPATAVSNGGDGDLFMQTIYFQAPTSVDSCDGVLGTLRQLAYQDPWKGTSMQAFALCIVIVLDELPWFSSPNALHDGYFSHVLQLHCRERVHAWMNPISGSAFGDPGSGCPLFTPVHRPPSNPSHVDVSHHDSIGEEEDERLPASPVLPSSSLTVSDSRSARYSSTPHFHDGEDGEQASDAGFQFSFEDAGGGDDTVNIDNDDDELVATDEDAIEVVKEDSCDRFEDQVWVEQAIQDVDAAVQRTQSPQSDDSPQT
ncbi:Hypothetical protein, putative [Bodo saltans]|uniref:Uncharacterized protein n=1 Tax=Bodo saltans TaxID=75058 RepID=A0A0S4J3R2_BODSA|nr:Hypothetical protein, putative [Bodo saltans]|eukprot:CUG86059.1 Hypothetical protein, putative [Bodo saltans]